MRRDALFVVLALAVLAIVLGPVGGAVFVLGLVYGDSPCVLCWAQRTGMVLVALVGLFVLRYGPRPRYLGLGVLLSAWGVFMAVRHSAAHVVRDVGQGFSVEILGAHTYIWSAFIFWISLVVLGVLLMLLKDGEAAATPRRFTALDRLATWSFLVVVAANAAQAFASTGPPPFMGQSDPVRFSLEPRHWVWSIEEWSPAPMSLRGRWGIEKPALDGLDPDPTAGPFSSLPVLTPSEHHALRLPVDGPITDLAFDADTRRFALTTAHGVYVADDALSRVLRSTVVDPGFSVDLARFAGVAFLDRQTVLAMAENKSFVVLREATGGDPARNYRFFSSGFDAFDEVLRSRIATVRAKMMYVGSVAFDHASNSVYTVSVPNRRVRRLVVSRVDRADMTLSQEFRPRLAEALTERPNRSIDELHVSGISTAGNHLYALSAAFSTLLTIDLRTATVVAAHAVTGLDRPVGLAVKDGVLVVAGEAGSIWMVPLPADAAVPPAAN